MLFTFPSRYWFAIGLSGVFSLAGWSRRGLSPAMAELSRTFFSQSECYGVVLLPRICVATHAVWALPRSLATTGGIIRLFSLPAGTKMFQFPAFASVSRIQIITLQVIGLSHSEIHGSEVICTYPWLIAAYHVLHRLREPRHPPDALTFFRQLRFKIYSVSKNKVLLTVLCVNMSKISVRTTRLRVGLRIGFAYPVSLRGE